MEENDYKITETPLGFILKKKKEIVGIFPSMYTAESTMKLFIDRDEKRNAKRNKKVQAI